MAAISSKHFKNYSHTALYIAWYLGSCSMRQVNYVATSGLVTACALADVMANEQGTYGMMHDGSRVVLMWISNTPNEDSLQYVLFLNFVS